MTSEPSGRSYFRIVRTDPPTADDFVAISQAGHRLVPLDQSTDGLMNGISVYSTLAQARRKGRASPGLGTFVAEVNIPDDADARIERTLGPGHHTVWADARDLLGWVVSIVPVAAAP